MSETRAAAHKSPNYAAVFWSLFFLTICEIVVANLHSLRKLIIIVSLILLACIKAGLVALFYMHLKFEKFLIYLIVIFPLFLAFTLTVLVLLDKGHIRVS